jgi:hypothetical protein
MTTRKVTVTLEAEQLKAIQALVAARNVDSVSGFVQHAVTVSLADVAGWRAMLDDALAATGGPLTRKERTWARKVLGVKPKSRRKRRAA